MSERTAAQMDSRTSEPRNRLLAALPPEDLLGFRRHLEPVALRHGQVLFEADEPLTRVYFVEAGIVSLVTVFEDGTTSEMAAMGREGVLGIGTLLGGDTALGRYLVQASGAALAMDASRFRNALRENQRLRIACEAYAQAFLAQLLQNVACNALHTVERRCARWLLTSHDRSDGDTFALTQEFLGLMLGVRRSTVTAVAGSLQKAGLIGYRRGAVTVLDRPGLEGASCECYRIVRDQYERLLPRPFR